MATKDAIEQTRSSLLAKAQEVRDRKNEAAHQQYLAILAKAQEVLDKKKGDAQSSYAEFVAKVEEDTAKRLKIVNKVIDAESEERLWREDQIRKKKESQAREEAEQRMKAEAERQRIEEEERQKKAEEKKAAKAKKKQLAMRAKVPIPSGFVSCSNSKKLYAKLKKINSAGRYGFCCFSMSKDAEFRTFCGELSQEFNDNVAWFDCQIDGSNFEEAMLLYEFNGTPAVVICFEGKPSNLHRYCIGFSDDTKQTLRRYAQKADAE